MTAADMIQLKDVVASCTQFMKSELHPSNAVGIYRLFFTLLKFINFANILYVCYRFSDVHNCRELIAASTKYIQDLFPIVCCEDEFLELPKEQLCFFLSSEHLKVDSEFQVITRRGFNFTPPY
jgi:actin-binding protein IPP